MRPLLIALLTALTGAMPAVAPAGTTGELAGVVIDGAAHKPLADAHVTARSPSQVEQTISDAAGRFTFVSLGPGTYTVVVSHPGYVTTVYPGIVISADVATPLSVTIPRNFSLVDFAVHPTDYLVRPGLSVDVYQITRCSNPFYDFKAGPMNVLHFVPGVTYGSGTVLAR